jgi:hypothetical protein
MQLMHTVVNQVDQFDHQTVLSNRTVDGVVVYITVCCINSCDE